MKSAIVALSALLALSGVSMAAPTTAPGQQAKAASECVVSGNAGGKKVKVDCTRTASVRKTKGETGTAGPRLGIGVNPFVPGL